MRGIVNGQELVLNGQGVKHGVTHEVLKEGRLKGCLKIFPSSLINTLQGFTVASKSLRVEKLSNNSSGQRNMKETLSHS